jgi:hypothetical protein
MKANPPIIRIQSIGAQSGVGPVFESQDFQIAIEAAVADLATKAYVNQLCGMKLDQIKGAIRDELNGLEGRVDELEGRVDQIVSTSPVLWSWEKHPVFKLLWAINRVILFFWGPLFTVVNNLVNGRRA